MLARTATIIKWTLYCAAGLLCMFVQWLVLNRLHIWGLIPFLYPLIVAIPSTMEGPLFGAAYGLVFGVLSDLLLPAPIPCFYTLIFPFVGFCAGFISRNLIPVGLLCSLFATMVSFFLTDLFHAIVFWAQNQAAWRAAAWVGVREFCITLPLILLITPLFGWVYRTVHQDD